VWILWDRAADVAKANERATRLEKAVSIIVGRVDVASVESGPLGRCVPGVTVSIGGVTVWRTHDIIKAQDAPLCSTPFGITARRTPDEWLRETLHP
jgi:hypothetical protein